MTRGGSATATRSRLVLERSHPAIQEASQRFEDFYVKEYTAVVGLAYALSGSRTGAEDLAQEAFLAAYSNWDRIAAYEQPGAWVRRVVANRSVSSFRRRTAEAKTAVRALPRRQAQVIALFYLEDRPIAEVAEVLEMSAGSVKRHLHDGRQTLARRLHEEVDE